MWSTVVRKSRLPASRTRFHFLLLKTLFTSYVNYSSTYDLLFSFKTQNMTSSNVAVLIATILRITIILKRTTNQWRWLNIKNLWTMFAREDILQGESQQFYLGFHTFFMLHYVVHILCENQQDMSITAIHVVFNMFYMISLSRMWHLPILYTQNRWWC